MVKLNDSTYRRCVNDIVTLGMAVTKRNNDPSYGIDVKYVDPLDFVHSYTEDPNFGDLVYAGHVERVSIGELKRRLVGRYRKRSSKKLPTR